MKKDNLYQKYNSICFEKEFFTDFNSQVILKIDIKKTYRFQKTEIIYFDDGFEITFRDYAKYSYKIEDNVLLCISSSIDDIISTIYNLPFSFLLSYRQRFLLHCSSIVKNKNVYCFCGEKGSGKSTVVNALNAYYEILSDDVLSINSNLNVDADNDYTLLKIDYDSSLPFGFEILVNKIKGLDKKILYKKNITDKNIKHISCIFYISKNRQSKTNIKKINNLEYIDILIKQNIIGYDYFENLIGKKFIDKKIKFYIIYPCENVDIFIKDIICFINDNFF